MPDILLVLAFSTKNISKLKRLFSPRESILWLYFGRDYFARRHLEEKLGSRFIRIDIEKLHDEVADDIKFEHVQWIDQLNRYNGNHLEWWFGRISSRNIYNSNLYQYSCYLEILERLWQLPDRRPRLICIESMTLAGAIQKWASKKGIAVDIINYNLMQLNSLVEYLFSFVRWGKFGVTLLLRYIAAMVSKKKYKAKKLGDNVVIVDTFIQNASLLDDGVFNDPYFPTLYEYLEERGNLVLIHPVLCGFRFNYFSIYQRMRKSNTHFIIAEDFLRFSDYLIVLSYPLKTLLQKIKAPFFRGFDLSDILRSEQRTLSDTSGLAANLIYRLFLRLGKAGLQPKIIICWYENQVIDRALIAGARHVFPQTKIIGAQMFIHLSNFLNVFPSQSEVEAKVVPHLLLEMSEHMCQVAQSFTNTIPCYPAAALRCAHIFNNNKTNTGSEQKKGAILVLLPFVIGESIEMLEMLKMGLEKISDDVQILVKCHPDIDPADLIRAFGKRSWPSKFEIFQGNLSGALDKASVVISFNSSTMVDAATRGIPIIFLGRQTALNQKIIFGIEIEFITECFTTDELVCALKKYLHLSPCEIERNREKGKIVRDLFFVPVNRETMAPFLGVVDGN